MRRFIFVSGVLFLCLIAVSGLALKLALGPDAPPDRAAELDLLQTRVESAGLRVLERQKLTNEGAYRGLMIVRVGCEGVAQAVPLYRNGEASGILAYWRDKGASVMFLNKGEASVGFPGTAFWFARVEARLHRLLGRGSFSRLLGVAEWGACGITQAVGEITKS